MVHNKTKQNAAMAFAISSLLRLLTINASKQLKLVFRPSLIQSDS